MRSYEFIHLSKLFIKLASANMRYHTFSKQNTKKGVLYSTVMYGTSKNDPYQWKYLYIEGK